MTRNRRGFSPPSFFSSFSGACSGRGPARQSPDRFQHRSDGLDDALRGNPGPDEQRGLARARRRWRRFEQWLRTHRRNQPVRSGVEVRDHVNVAGPQRIDDLVPHAGREALFARVHNESYRHVRLGAGLAPGPGGRHRGTDDARRAEYRRRQHILPGTRPGRGHGRRWRQRLGGDRHRVQSQYAGHQRGHQ